MSLRVALLLKLTLLFELALLLPALILLLALLSSPLLSLLLYTVPAIVAGMPQAEQPECASVPVSSVSVDEAMPEPASRIR